MGSETVASAPPPPSFTFWGADKRKLVTLQPDGRIELGEGVTLDEATLAFWQGVEAAGFARLNAELESLRASLTRVEEERDADQRVLRAVRDWIAKAEFDDGSPTNCPVSAIAPTGLLAAVERCLSRPAVEPGKDG